MATNFFELATTLKNLGAKWQSEKKINFTPCSNFIFKLVQISRIKHLLDRKTLLLLMNAFVFSTMYYKKNNREASASAELCCLYCIRL